MEKSVNETQLEHGHEGVMKGKQSRKDIRELTLMKAFSRPMSCYLHKSNEITVTSGSTVLVSDMSAFQFFLFNIAKSLCSNSQETKGFWF